MMGDPDVTVHEQRSPFAEPPVPGAPAPAPAPPAARRPSSPRQPSALASIDWDSLRRKFWHGGLILASAYVSAKPEKYGWLMPVITAVSGTSAPPITGRPLASPAAVLAVAALVLGWRAWAA